MSPPLNDISAKVVAQLQILGWRLASAESCTGGLVGHLLTEVPGSSASYYGGVIAYDNEVKRAVLGVSPETLNTVGAVSEACAMQMAAGVKKLFGAEIAIATTGIAGPGGGTAAKPVGLVYIAVVTPTRTSCERHVFDGDRSGNKLLASRRALELILEMTGIPGE